MKYRNNTDPSEKIQKTRYVNLNPFWLNSLLKSL